MSKLTIYSFGSVYNLMKQGTFNKTSHKMKRAGKTSSIMNGCKHNFFRSIKKRKSVDG
ncbi:hypothetical protein B4121_3142 [Bacillus paralicheniformis]|uniref:Uncharacterized protein n=1 Tax=Bacillus paralicheniformis TaxID=1648923 RepID=A0A7Z0WWH0_9BACI|nr:hypothetical protein B4121_3142 [Bacillus paralicheniformis]